MKSKDDAEDVRINFRGGRIYIDKFKDSNNFAGYILVLKNMKGYSLSQENDIIHVSIVDKSDHKREMFLNTIRKVSRLWIQKKNIKERML